MISRDVPGARSRRINGPALAAAIALCCLMTGACRTVYDPNTLNMPLLRQQGQLRGTIDVGNLQLAYAVNNSVGIMANGYLHNSTGNDQESSNNGIDLGGSGWLVEGGAGYFTTEADDIILEAYGGIGYGHVSIEERRKDGTGPLKTFDAAGTKLFLQPVIGIAGDVVEIGIAPRVSIVKYFGIEHQNYSEQELADYHLNDLDAHTWMFIEPALTVRVGYRAIKAQLQVGASYKLNNAPINANKSILNIGFSILLDT